MKRFILALAASLAIVPGVWAENFKVDPAHTTLLFRVKHVDVSYSYGRINSPEGAFELNGDELKSISVAARPENVDTDNQKRDDHLRGPDFFNVKQFPDITFKSTEITPAEGGWTVIGEFTMHGVTKPVTIELKKTGEADHPQMGHRAGIEGSFSIKRSEFGMDKIVGPVGDDVDITVAIEGIKE